MKTLMITSLMLAMSSMANPQEVKSEQKHTVERENTEWCNVWIPSASKTDKPRVLLVGDSIANGYYGTVCRHLKEEAYCAKFVTSACVADPAFQKQLEAMISQYKFTIIHFNNGLHGIGYTEDEYRVGYEKALKSIRKQSSTTKLVLALTTPLKETSNKNHLNPRMNERNRIVRELAETYDATVNDLHSISDGHPEYYKDPYHFQRAAVILQGKQVGDTINTLLKGEKKNSPDKK